MRKNLFSIFAFLLSSIFAFSQGRGRVNESEWRDPDDSETSIFSYIITIAIIFGIPWLISEIIKSKDEKNKH